MCVLVLQIPHYNLEHATDSVKPVMGPYYREPVKSGWFPTHLFAPLVRSFQNDHYVEDEGELLFLISSVLWVPNAV